MIRSWGPIIVVIVSLSMAVIGFWRLWMAGRQKTFFMFLAGVVTYPIVLFLFASGISDRHLRLWVMAPIVCLYPVWLLSGCFVYHASKNAKSRHTKQGTICPDSDDTVTTNRRILDFDDIVFKDRNMEYGAYVLRKKYFLNISVSLFAGIVILTSGVIISYLKEKVSVKNINHSDRQVEIKLENLQQPDEIIIPPPPLPPQPVSVFQQIRYIPPVVLDSVKPDDTTKLLTNDEAFEKVKNEKVEIKQDIKEELHEVEARPEPFVHVEEMPVPEGGEAGLLRYISDNLIYPTLAKENNIQGRVVVRFCVTSSGGVDLVSIIKSVDPELDKEAIRVIKSLHPFKPGRNEGKPVPVWFSLPIDFKLE